MDKTLEPSASFPSAEWRDSVDSDFDALADQLQRCQSAHEHWSGLGERLQSFAVPRVLTMAVLGAAMLLLLRLTLLY